MRSLLSYLYSFFFFQTAVVLIAESPYYEKLFKERLVEKIAPGLDWKAVQVGWRKGSPNLKLQALVLSTDDFFMRAAEASVIFTPLLYVEEGVPYRITLSEGSFIHSGSATQEQSLHVPVLNLHLVDFVIASRSSPQLQLRIDESTLRHKKYEYAVTLQGSVFHQEREVGNIKSIARLKRELPLTGSLYIETENLLLSEGWMAMTDGVRLPQNVKEPLAALHSIRGDARLWVDLAQGRIADITMDVSFEEVIIQAVQEVAIQDLHILSSFHNMPSRSQQIWHFEEASFFYKEKRLSFRQGQVMRRSFIYDIYVPEFDSGVFASLMLPFIQNASMREQIGERNPSGMLRDLRIQVDTRGKNPFFQLDAALDGISIAPYRTTPGATGIRGQLHIEDARGWLMLDAADSSLFIAHLYEEPFRFDGAQGFFAWEWLVEKELLFVGDAHSIRNNKQLATMKLSLHIVPFQHSYIDLLIGLKNSQLEQARSYIPTRIMNHEVVEWLDLALQEARVAQAAMAIHGDMKYFDNSETQFELLMDIEDARFKHSIDMPALVFKKASFSMDKRNIEVSLPSGGTMTSIVDMKGAVFRFDMRELDLDIKAEGSIPASALSVIMMKYINVPADFFEGWQLGGSLNGNWRFAYGLREESLKDISFSVRLAQGILKLPFLPSAFQQGEGMIGFSMQNGYTGQLTVRFGDETLLAGFGRSRNTNYLRVKGWADANDFVPSQLRKHISGRSFFNVRLSKPIAGGLAFNRIEIESSLHGTELNMPAPFSKKAAANMPISYELDFDSLKMRHQVNVAGTGSFGWQRKDDGVKDIFVHLVPSSGKALSNAMIVRLDNINLTAWNKLANSLRSVFFSEETEQAEKETIGVRDFFSALLTMQNRLPHWDVAIKNAEWNNRIHQAVKLRYSAAQGRWISFSSEDMAGRLFVEEDSSHIHFARINFVADTSNDEGILDELPNRLPSVTFANMPDLFISIADMSYRGKPLGQANLNITFRDDEMTVHSSELLLGIPLDGYILWRALPMQSSSIELNLFGAGRLNEPLGPIVQSEELSFSINLKWQGRNEEFDRWRETAKGRIILNMKEGLIASQQASVLTNLFDLLNIDNLLRRLSGDFSDLSDERLEFEIIDADMELMGGRLNTREQAVAKLSFAEISAKGYYDLVAGYVDYEVLVASPVTKVLPLTALLLGASSLTPFLLSLDIVGDDFFTRFSTAAYHVKGDTAQPDVMLVRIGDIQGNEISPEELSKKIDIQQPLRNLRF